MGDQTRRRTRPRGPVRQRVPGLPGAGQGPQPNTVRAYLQDLTIFLTYCAGVDAVTLGHVDRVLLRAYQSHLARRTERVVVLSDPTRHRWLVALRSCLEFCAREEWSPGDLGVTIDLAKLPRRLPKPLDSGQLERMIADPGAAPKRATHSLAAAEAEKRLRDAAAHEVCDSWAAIGAVLGTSRQGAHRKFADGPE